MFSYLYTDEIYNYCGSSYEILRTWKVRDMCGSVTALNPRVYVQVIKVFDTTGPVFHSCEDIVVDASSYACTGQVEIPVPMISDNCNEITLNVTVNGAAVNVSGDYANGDMEIIAHNMGLGNHPARFIATDNCNNKKVCEFNIEVVDNSPPIPVCEQYKTVSLTVIGSAKVEAEDFDSGSFDNCNPVYIKVLRVDGDLNYDGGCEDLNGDDNPSTSAIDVWYDDEVFFCCEDLGQQIMVNMRVYDVDPGEGPVSPNRMLPGGDLYGHYNDCWSIVTVECKVPPLLTCENVTVTCEESLDPEENTNLWPEVIYVCSLDDITYTDVRNNGVCGASITRTWTATACGKTSTCKQTITIEGTEQFDPCSIVFPADKTATCSNELPDGGEPTWTENPCNVVTAEIVKEDTFKFVDDACYKIVREWAVIDWCVYESNTGAELNVDAVTSARKLNCNELVEDGYYRYTQVLMLIDNIAPEIEVEDQCVGTTDCYAYDVTLNAIASDSCNANEKFNWKYIVTNTDTWETVQYSYNYTPEPSQGTKGSKSKDKLDDVKESKLVILDELPIGNYKVTWTVGDGCGNATSKDQYFTVADKKAPTPVMVDIATAIMENGMVELSARWFDKGGCGDGCISSFDNCTPTEDLYFTYTPVLPDFATNPTKWEQQYAIYGRYFFDPQTGAISTEAKYLAGEAHAWEPQSNSSQKLWFCEYEENADTTLEIEVYVWDKFALNDQCDDNNYEVAIVDLRLNHCGDATLSGTVRADGAPFEGMPVKASSNEESYIKNSDSEGRYEFVVNPDEYKIEANSDEDYSKGITTLDIVIIQKYILGIKQITDPYILIAGDVNNNKKVSASDIAELRRLILGIDNSFTNHSWVGINTSYEFVNPTKAFEEAEQASTIEVNIQSGESKDGLDFDIVKIGDMNNSHNTNALRSEQSMQMEIDNTIIHKGEELEIPVKAKDFTDIYGYQIAINMSDLENIHIVSGEIEIGEENMNIVNGRLLLSWNDGRGKTVEEGKTLFTIIAKSNSETSLSNAMNIDDRALRAEAYKGEELEIRNIKIDFINHEFQLYQNQPNPFTGITTIGFELPESTDYLLTIYDVTGKEIKSYNGSGKTGYNKVDVEKQDLLSSGVYYYKITADKNTDTKKMIFYR
ncbi:MAG: T9SS type A sorting domain-containing protein [Saprospiraceae bacterium]